LLIEDLKFFTDFLQLQEVKGLGLGVFINAEGAEDEEDGWVNEQHGPKKIEGAEDEEDGWVNEQHGPKKIVLLPERKWLSISFIWL